MVVAVENVNTFATGFIPMLGETTINIGSLAGGVADNVIAPWAEARLMARLVTPAAEVEDLLRRWIADRAALEFEARTAQVGIFRQTVVPAAQRLASMAEESYKAGKANILTVIDAQRNASQVQQEYLDSLLLAQQAYAELEEVVGGSLD
jgi:metal-dependent amidase/aminoacylase/carboxypeptidase family protein